MFHPQIWIDSLTYRYTLVLLYFCRQCAPFQVDREHGLGLYFRCRLVQLLHRPAVTVRSAIRGLRYEFQLLLRLGVRAYSSSLNQLKLPLIKATRYILASTFQLLRFVSTEFLPINYLNMFSRQLPGKILDLKANMRLAFDLLDISHVSRPATMG